MAFRLLFLFSLVLGSVFLDANGLVEHEDEISSLEKLERGFAERGFFFFFIRAAYRRKYLKRRVMYSCGHCGEAGNTTVIGTQLYFTSVQQRYKHGGHVE